MRYRTAIALLALLGISSACGGASSAPRGADGSRGRGTAAGRPASTTTTGVPTLTAALTPWTLPDPVSRPVVLDQGGKILIMGGLATGDVSTDAVVTVDPSSGTTQTPGALEEAVHDAAGAILGTTAYVFGGGSYTTVAAVQGWTGTGTATVVGDLPVARSDLSAAMVGSTAYVLGGFDGTELQGPILATQDGVHFKVVGDLPQPVRYAAVAVDHSGDIWVIGGELGTSEDADLGGNTDDIQRFDPATGLSSVVGHLPVALGHAEAMFLDGQLWVTGGRTASGASAAIWRVDTSTGAVTPGGSLPGPRSDAGAVVINGVGYLVGGEVSGPTAPLDTVVELNPGGGGSGDPSAAPTTSGTTSTTVNIYAADGPNMLSPVVKNMPYLIYVPESSGDHVDVINPHTYKVIDRYVTGENPQHVVPAWNLKTLYATNDEGNSLTPINPYSGLPGGPNIPVTDPYNMYFTPNGKYAIVVEEARQILAFRNPNTFALIKDVPVDCPGVDHGDFSADGTWAIFSCEFSSRMVKINVINPSVMGYLNIPGSDLQDVKLDSAGQVFYTADMSRGGVYEVSAATFKVIGFLPTGRMAHGLYVSRDGKYMYVTDRGEGAISVVDLATRSVIHTWYLPGGGSPDMGNLSPDGKVLWVSGRYNACVYAISTVDGHLIAKIPVPNSPHGLAVWPQPGRYSIGHTGIMR